MFKEKKILAVVPARGGSKGVPKKNIRPLGGKPLIAHTAELIQTLDFIDRAIVSTDSDEIAAAAEAAGLAAPFRRPEALAGDMISDIDVLEHAVQAIEKIDETQYDIVLMLQPTSPCRTQEHIFQCLEKLVAEQRDTVWTVSPVDSKHHPLKQLRPTDDGGMELWDDEGEKIIARQQLGASYIRNGAVYAFTRDCLMNKHSIYGDNMGFVLIEEPLANIDTFADFEQAEAMLK